MSDIWHRKSSVEQIRSRFDGDVERFSNLETGQQATMDAPLSMELITQAALAVNPAPERILDIGCGAGNNSLRLRLSAGMDFQIDLIDLSQPMLERACQRLTGVNRAEISRWQGDFRDWPSPGPQYDVIIAAAVFHHLRDDRDWEKAFEKVFHSLKPGGSFWITDLVFHDDPAIHQMMWERYGQYLVSLGGEEYRDAVFQYIDQEDSPRSLTYQMNLMHQVGFSQVDVLHKNSCFAAFGGIR